MSRYDPLRSALATILLVLVVCGTLLTFAVPASATQDSEPADPETADEYFETFRSMEDNEAYESYGELETIRSFALQRTQVGAFTPADRTELNVTLASLRSFEAAYEHAENGDYEASFEAGAETEDHLAELAAHDESQAELASLAVARFYEDLGDEFRGEIDATNRTSARLEVLSMTASAYERAGQPDEAAEFRLQAESQTAVYERDLEYVADVENETAAFLDSCRGCADPKTILRESGPNVLDVFDRYQRSQTLFAESLDAQRRAEKHGLEDREAALADTTADLRERRSSLAVASGGLLLGYGLTLGLGSIVLLSRVFVWRRAVDAAQIDSVVPMGENDV